MTALVFGSPEAARALKEDRAAIAEGDRLSALDAAERAGKLMRDNGSHVDDEPDDMCDHLFRGPSQKALCGAERLTGRWSEWRKVWRGPDDNDDLCAVCQVEAKRQQRRAP